jgi:hypothetical protein
MKNLAGSNPAMRAGFFFQCIQYCTQFGRMAELNESELVLQKQFKKRYFP